MQHFSGPGLWYSLRFALVLHVPFFRMAPRIAFFCGTQKHFVLTSGCGNYFAAFVVTYIEWVPKIDTLHESDYSLTHNVCLVLLALLFPLRSERCKVRRFAIT